MVQTETLGDGRTVNYRSIGKLGTTPHADYSRVWDWINLVKVLDLVTTTTVEVGVLVGEQDGSNDRTGRELRTESDPIQAIAVTTGAWDSSHFPVLICSGPGPYQILDEFISGHTFAGLGNLTPTGWGMTGPDDLRYNPATKFGAHLVHEGNNTNRRIFDIQSPYFKMEGVAGILEGTVDTGVYEIYSIDASNVIVNSGFAHAELGSGTSGGIYGYRVQSGRDNIDFRNCQAIGSSVGGEHGLVWGFVNSSGSSTNVYAYNCMAHNCANTRVVSSSGFTGLDVCQDCVSTSSHGSDFTTVSTKIRCVSEDSSGSPGYSPYLPAAIMVRPDFHDLRSRKGSFLIQRGEIVDAVTPANDPFNPFMDYTGKRRYVAGDIGAYQGGVDAFFQSPDDVIVKVGTGLDYTTLQAAIDGTSGFPVADNERRIIEVWEDQAVSTQVDIGTDASNLAVSDDRRYRIIRAAAHLWGRVRIAGAPNAALIRNWTERYLRIEGIVFDHSGSGNLARKCVRIGARDNTIDQCSFQHSNAGGTGKNRDCVHIESGTLGNVVQNSIAYGHDAITGPARGFRHDGDTGALYNCTAVAFLDNLALTPQPKLGEAIKLGGSGSSVAVINCASLGSSKDFEDASGVNGRMSYCISSDTTANGFQSQVSKTLAETFEDVSASLPVDWDLRLKEGSPALGAGTDLSSFFSVDYAGRTVPPWDVGAHAGIATDATFGLVNPRGRKRHRYTRLIRVSLLNGQGFFFTDYPESIRYDGAIWSPLEGVIASASNSESGFRDAGMDVVGAITSGAITEPMLVAEELSGATVIETILNPRYPFHPPYRVKKYELESVSFDGYKWSGSLSGLPHQLKLSQGDVTTEDCRNRLGDDRCLVDVRPLSVLNQTVVAVNADEPRRIFEVSPTAYTAFVDDYFADGEVLWLTGANAGKASDCKVYDRASAVSPFNTSFEMWHRLPYDIEVGDKFDSLVGCDRQEGTCKTKFTNFPNFRGEPHTPGDDAAIAPPER